MEGHDIPDVSEYVDQLLKNTKKWWTGSAWIWGDTLRYQKVEDMVKAIGLPKEKLCLYCWTGRCPRPAADGPAPDQRHQDSR